MKIAEANSLSFNPFGRRRFQFFDDIDDFHVFVQKTKRVNMIVVTADQIAMAMHIIQCAGDVGKQFGADFLIQTMLPVFGAEDDMTDNSNEGLRHFIPPFQGLAIFVFRYPGRWPGL
jgi:hypothetical protein